MDAEASSVHSQVEVGEFVLVGSITEENRLRGIALDEAQRIASDDPLVQSVHLVIEVHAGGLVERRVRRPSEKESGTRTDQIHAPESA
jgi:hypothetical protein